MVQSVPEQLSCGRVLQRSTSIARNRHDEVTAGTTRSTVEKTCNYLDCSGMLPQANMLPFAMQCFSVFGTAPQGLSNML